LVADSVSPLAPIEWGTPHQQRQADEALMLTGDQSLVELAATIQYRIADVQAYRFGVRDPDSLLKTVAEGMTREVMAAQPLLRDKSDGKELAEILTDGRAALERQIRAGLQQRLDRLGTGIEVLPEGVCLQEIHPPLDVIPAFRDVSSAFKEKERLKNEADAFYRDRLIKAAGENAYRELSAGNVEADDALWTKLAAGVAGEAAAERNRARAWADDKQQLATGGAEAFALLEAAHAGQPELTEWRAYIEALSAALPGKKKLVLDSQLAGRRHLLLGLGQAVPEQLAPLLQTNTEQP
jgi:regulator of protease activity HflC (stomatin/prohibitin superfamily)